METTNKVDDFLSQYDEQVFRNAITLRNVIIANLPNIIEQVDIPARMIAYCYGQKYSELICTIIPSKKGLKLGFNWGTELPESGFEGYKSGNEAEHKGFGHICVFVDELHKACDRFTTLGVRFKKRPEDGQMKNIAFILDPDGYWIEIIQKSSGDKESK